MPVKYDYDPVLNIVHTKFYGKHTHLDVTDHFRELSKNNDIKNGFINIVYLESIDDYQVTSSENQTIVENFTKLKQKKAVSAVVFVCKSDLHFGYGRMAQSWHEVKDESDEVYIARNDAQLAEIISKLTASSP